jgi:4-hydroxybenzoate polyprenyltransferase
MKNIINEEKKGQLIGIFIFFGIIGLILAIWLNKNELIAYIIFVIMMGTPDSLTKRYEKIGNIMMILGIISFISMFFL